MRRSLWDTRYVFPFVILNGKIAKEDAIFEKSLFCEKCLEYDFTWKKCWFQIKIQNFILMTRPTAYSKVDTFIKILEVFITVRNLSVKKII